MIVDEAQNPLYASTRSRAAAHFRRVGARSPEWCRARNRTVGSLIESREKASKIQLGALVLEGTPNGALDGVHDIVRRVAATYDAEVAEVFGQMGAGDYVGLDDCLHPADTGHDIVSNAFGSSIDD